jgi:hypothetical protein
MPPNLEQEYDEVVSYIKEYLAFPLKIVRRRSSHPFRFLLTSYSNMGRSFKVLYSFNPMSGKSPSAYKDFVERLASESEKNEEYYKILISEYPMDALSESIKNKFKKIDFEKLLKAHERRGFVFTGFGMKEALGFILATAGLILKTVPQKIVEQVFQMTYEDFEVTLFWGMLFLAGYAFIILFPHWMKIINSRNIYNQVGYILKYMVIKYY